VLKPSRAITLHRVYSAMNYIYTINLWWRLVEGGV